MAVCRDFHGSVRYFSHGAMNRTWIPIALIGGVSALGALAVAGMTIYQRISYDVLSYSIRSIGQNGMTIRIVFGVSNDSNVDVDLWNQRYDVYVSGYKVSEITSIDRYKILAGNSTLLPLDVDLFWDELEASAPSINSQLQVNSIASLPVVIRGTLAAKTGILKLRKIPVRWATTVGTFLP